MRPPQAPACRPRTSGSWPPRRACSSACDPLVWNWTESEHSDGRTRFAILKGGAAWKAEGSDWYVDGGAQEPGVLARSCCSPARSQRSSQIGFRLAVDSMSRAGAGIRVVEAATLFAAPLAGMFLGDFGADVIKIEHPRAPDPARGHGPAQGRRGPLVQGARPQQAADHARPLEARRPRRSSSISPPAPTSCSRTSGRERSSAGVPARTSSGRANPRLVIARVTGFGQTGPYASPRRVRDARRGDERLRRAERRARRAAAPAAARAGRRGRRASRPRSRSWSPCAPRAQTGRGQIVDTSLVEPLMTLLGPQLTAYDLLGELQPRTGNRSSHNAPRNVYRHGRRRLGRGVRERDLDRRASAPPRRPPRSGRAAVVRDRLRPRGARRRDRRRGRRLDRRALARRGARRVRGGGRRDRPDLRRAATFSPTRSFNATGTIVSVDDDKLGAVEDAEHGQPPLRDAGRDPVNRRSSRRRHGRRARGARR